MSENIANTEVQEAKVSYSVEYILTKMAEIQAESAHLNEALARLGSMTDGDSGSAGAPGNIAGAEKAKAFGDIVRYRETTNQQMLRIYEKMYDDLTTSKQSANLEADKWNAICKLADVAYNEDDYASERSEMLDTIRQILRENR